MEAWKYVLGKYICFLPPLFPADYKVHSDSTGAGCESRTQVPWGHAGCGWTPCHTDWAPSLGSWRAADHHKKKKKEIHDNRQLHRSNTSKQFDRIHKSTVAAQIRVAHVSNSQTATPKVMRAAEMRRAIVCFIIQLISMENQNNGGKKLQLSIFSSYVISIERCVLTTVRDTSKGVVWQRYNLKGSLLKRPPDELCFPAPEWTALKTMARPFYFRTFHF